MSGLKDWTLERRGEELCWGGCRLSGLAREYGTPLFVVNQQVLEESVRSITGVFAPAGLKARIFFSYKTNPVPEVLRVMARAGVGAEVISELELRLAGRLGLSGERIIVNGGAKSETLLRLAVERGADMITVQRLTDLQALARIGQELGKQVNVGLRINPGLRTRIFSFTVSTGTARSPIGFVLGSQEWREALRTIAGNPVFRFRGLHFHIGSGIRTSAPYREALRNTLSFLDDLRSEGLQPEVLDIGGGYNISTLKEIDLWEAIRLFAWNKPQRPPRFKPPTELLQEVAQVCAGILGGYCRDKGIPIPEIFVEPGRALSASSQLLLLGVKSVVERKTGRLAAICDGGAMSLSHLLLSEYHSIFVANKSDGLAGKRYNLYGSLPTPLDFVAAERRLPPLASGDVLAVMDTGAYFTSLSNNFAGPRPAVAMVDRGAARLIRRRETFEDIFSRDTIFHNGEQR
ncbi:MAG: alanine racemase [Candidatus Aminicenantes bacterium]|nr:alanine racemase [Candidatus Aminicenantes bacterium]